jgi:phenylalanyl-tRNA synthetase beta chain
VVRIVEGREEPLDSPHLAAVIQDPAAGFADLKSVVVALARELGRELSVRPSRDPVFLEGRGADLWEAGRQVGKGGEVHPEVLERFVINVPVALFEIEL